MKPSTKSALWSIIFRKLYPVFDCQSLNRFREAFFSEVDNIFEKRIYLYIKDILMCLVLLIGSIKYLCFLWVMQIILNDFSSIAVALLSKFHNDEPGKWVLKILLNKNLVVGCANENSVKVHYFLLCTVLFFQ